MSWIDGAIESGNAPIDVDVSDLDLDVDVIQVKPISANEYNLLKQDPEVTKITDEQDRMEILGMLTVCTMLKKCDNTISWGKFRQMPLTLISKLATLCTEAVGTDGGGGVLGE